jgi:hypothetical protein
MLHDPAFREAVLEQQKVVRGSATVEGDVVRIDQVQASAGLPSFVTKIVGNEIHIVRVERWHGDDADIEFSTPGRPGEITGRSTLAEVGGRTLHTVTMDVSVRVPLVGGKIEGVVAAMLAKAYDKEHATGVEWLAG